jgi:phage replication-related protein YjqB (UPF0714/DUF867 family)
VAHETVARYQSRLSRRFVLIDIDVGNSQFLTLKNGPQRSQSKRCALEELDAVRFTRVIEHGGVEEQALSDLVRNFSRYGYSKRVALQPG